jgi:hypothetical protein
VKRSTKSHEMTRIKASIGVLRVFSWIVFVFQMSASVSLLTRARSMCSFLVVSTQLSSSPFSEPGLEHQYVPQEILPVMRSLYMLVPFLSNRLRIKEAVSLKSTFV